MSAVAERKLMEALEYRVRFERRHAFGDSAPPFDADHYDDAVTWIEDRIREQDERYPPEPEWATGRMGPPERSQKVFELKRKLERAAMGISRLTGLHYTHGRVDRRLRYVGRDDVGRPVGRTVVVRGMTSSLVRLADLAENAASAGLLEEEVVSWVLCGLRPRFRRAVVARGVNYIYRDESDPKGPAELPVPYVQITVFTPDLRHEDLRGLHRSIRRAWSRLDEDLGPAELVAPGVWRVARRGGSPAAPKLTPRDALLLEAIEAVGGYPESVPAGFWEEVAAEWARHGRFPSRDADSHARHWRRLQQKLRNAQEAHSAPEA